MKIRKIAFDPLEQPLMVEEPGLIELHLRVSSSVEKKEQLDILAKQLESKLGVTIYGFEGPMIGTSSGYEDNYIVPSQLPKLKDILQSWKNNPEIEIGKVDFNSDINLLIIEARVI